MGEASKSSQIALPQIVIQVLSRSNTKIKSAIKALRPKGRSFPAWCFLYIVPLDPALKGGDYGVLSVQDLNLMMMCSVGEMFETGLH